MKKGYRLLACMLVLSLLSLAGCSREVVDEDQVSERVVTTVDTDSSEQEVTELSFWNIVDDPNNAMSKRFEESINRVEANRNVTINYDAISGQTYHTKIKVALAGNELPDLFIIQPGDNRDPFIKAEAVMPLNKILENSGYMDKFYEGYLQADNNGDIYSLPFRVDMVEVMYYNKQIFKEVGITVPTSWDEFSDAIVKIKEKGYAPIGLGNKDRWMGDLLYNTMVLREDPKAFENAYKGETSFATAPFLRAAEKVQSIANLGGFQKGYMGAIEPEVVEMFEAGQIAMYFNGTWAFDDLMGRLGDDFGYAPVPSIGEDKNYMSSICGTRNTKPWGFMVSAQSDYAEEAALTLIEFVEENNALTIEQGGIPYMESDAVVQVDINPEFARFIEDMKKVKFIQTYWADFLPKEKGEPYRDLNQKLFTGKLDPKEYVEKQDEILGD